MIYLAIAGFLIALVILFKCADFFVEGASSISRILNVPKLIIGIVLIGLSTTAPEFAVSVIAAFKRHPEIALGNAIGSVICDDCIALALAAILASSVIFINCRLLKIVGVFLLSIDVVAYLLARDGTLSRGEGLILLGLLVLYFVLLFRYKQFRLAGQQPQPDAKPEEKSNSRNQQLKRPLILILAGLAGVILTAEIIVRASVYIARYFSVPEIIIGSTVVAIGTSLPEISTCITAARRGEGELAVGNILGADVLNILWIIGMASVVRPIHVELDIINFKFPYMILVVAVMLFLMRIGCRLGKIKGFILLALYAFYLYFTFTLFI